MNLCRDTFLKIVNHNKYRVIGVFKRFKTGLNQVPMETRGGDSKRNLFECKKKFVINFIKELRAFVLRSWLN